MLASSALENLQLDRKARNLTSSWRSVFEFSTNCNYTFGFTVIICWLVTSPKFFWIILPKSSCFFTCLKSAPIFLSIRSLLHLPVKVGVKFVYTLPSPDYAGYVKFKYHRDNWLSQVCMQEFFLLFVSVVCH